jgi:CheY-like chemotaxis protein
MTGPAREAAVSVTGTLARIGPVRALIAEDETNLRDELRETLADLWPELVICAVAVDGIEALQQLERHAPDVLFLDIQLPGMSGLEVAKRASGHRIGRCPLGPVPIRICHGTLQR